MSSEADNDLGHKTWQRRQLTVSHMCAITFAAAWLAFVFPPALGPIALLLAAALVAEICPIEWRRFFIGEGLLLAVGLLTYIWTRYIDGIDGSVQALGGNTAFAGWLHMVIAFWALIPSRPGMMRFFGVLLACEMLLFNWVHSDLSLHVLLLLPASLAAFATDSWIRSSYKGNGDVNVGRSRRSSLLTAIIPPSLMVAAVAMSSGEAVMAIRNTPTVQQNERSSGLGDLGTETNNQGGNLSETMSLGSEVWSDKDPSTMAILDVEGPIFAQTVYLRALTVPYITFEGEEIAWQSDALASTPIAEDQALHSGHSTALGSIFRHARTGDVVLRPDHSNLISLPGMRADDDNNLYRDGLGSFPRRYAADLGAERSPHPTNDILDHWQVVPEELLFEFQEKIPELEQWRILPATEAAIAVRNWLQARAQYAIRSLPEPRSGLGGSIRTFLFGSAVERRGHCQYFTTASVLLLRSAGHPARPVVGYASDDVSGSRVTFRALHAHAWSEVLDENGWWHRIDSTPPSHMQQRQEGVSFGEEAVTPEEAVAIGAEPEGMSWWPIIISGLGLMALAGFIALRNRKQQNPRERALAKQTDSLFKLANAMGIRIDQHTTLSSVVRSISAMSGIDLESDLQQHLKARYSNGPLPQPWPLAQIKSAWERKREQKPGVRPTAETMSKP